MERMEERFLSQSIHYEVLACIKGFKGEARFFFLMHTILNIIKRNFTGNLKKVVQIFVNCAIFFYCEEHFLVVS